jgi:hypothetical protein
MIPFTSQWLGTVTPSTAAKPGTIGPENGPSGIIAADVIVVWSRLVAASFSHVCCADTTLAPLRTHRGTSAYADFSTIASFAGTARMIRLAPRHVKDHGHTSLDV